MALKPLFVLRDVGFVRDGRRILDGVSWTIREGERWLLLGRNGAGKTTLLRILAGYLAPSEGTILREGKDLRDLRAFRRRIAFVSDDLLRRIPPEDRAWEVVAGGADGTIGRPLASTRTLERRARRALAEFAPEADLADRPFGVLSQGERQAVLLARAALVRPKALLLDDPAAGLDAAARRRYFAGLARFLAAHPRAAAVLVTHRPSEAPRAFRRAMRLAAEKVKK